MARTKINNTQLLKLTQASSVLGGALDITGSTVIGEAVSDEMMLMIQSGSETPKKVLASELATYFNQAVSVTSVSDGSAHKIVFVDSTGAGQTLQADNDSFTYTPSTNLLTVGGSIVVGNTSTIGNAAVTDLITFNADGDIVIKNGTHDFDIASHDGTNGLKLEGTLVTADASEINKLDGVTATTTELNYVDVTSAGTVEASKAVVVDGNKDATSFRNITGTGTFTAYTALSGSKLVVGSADMSEADLEQLDGITAGTVAASKAVVVDSDKDASGFRNVTATGAITGGSFVIGSADISEAELEQIDGITAGTVAASKAVVVDANKDIAGFRDLTIAGTGSIAGDLTITGNLQVDGTQTIINTTHLEVADKTLLIASGSANAAAADGAGIVVEDIAGDDKSILFQNTGTNFKSSENFDIANGKVYKINNTEVLSATALTIGSAEMSEADLEKLDGITNGTVAASKAVVVDSDKDASGFRNVTATGAITGGSFVIGSADISEAELEQIDGITAGTVAASKAVVVDANKDAAGFRNLSASTNVSASAFYGDGSNLTGVGAEVSTSAANSEFKLSFVVDAAADAASLLIDSTAHGTYNPSQNRIGVSKVSSSVDLQLEGGAGLSLTASAGDIVITGSTGIKLESVLDTAITLNADSLYFKDADGRVKSDTIADIMGLVAGTVTDTGIADSSGVLSLAIHSLNAETIATGDKIAFSDAGDNGLHSETIDDLFAIGPALVPADTVAVADDHFLFLDGGASGEANKASISSLVTAVAGDGLTATDGVIAIDPAEVHFFSASSNTGADGGMSSNLLTASLNTGADGNVLADSLQVFLNGMLQTVSSSAGHTSATGVFDYRLDNASTPTEIHLESAIDSDDILVVRYLRK